MTVVVPFFNECGRVERVVESLVEAGFTTVAVDDGSRDGGLQKAPNSGLLMVVRHEKNKGKSAALETGLESVETEYAWLLDADVLGFNPRDYERGLEVGIKHDLDMVYFRRSGSVATSKATRIDLLLTGDRLVKTEKLKVCMKQRRPNGFKLEMALNQAALDGGWRVKWHRVPNFNPLKMKKYGWKDGLRRDLMMYGELMRDKGWLQYARQFAWAGEMQRV